MSKIMLVNVTHVEESRVAVLDEGVLDAYEIETINRTQIRGNIYNAVVDSVHPSLEAAFLRLAPDLKGFLPLDEVNFKLLPSRGDNRKAGTIGRHLHQGQKLIAQVVREPFAGKPPTVSTYFSLPGRYLVLMPGVDSAGVSRKIDDSSQRERLKMIVEELRPPEGFGVIVRTAGLGQTKLELQRDMRYLLRLWQAIQRASSSTDFPGLVYREADLVIRTIRDHFTPDISEVWIDSQETYDRALEFVQDVMPTRAKTIRLYTGDRPLFNKFNLEEQIESIFQRRVSLPSGGEIVIDGTEALTAIDVNSARSKRQGDAEENTTQTNLEAVAEISRQLRLRDLGGLIVIDFIDMAASRNTKKVEKAMRDAMRSDKAKYDVTHISKMGLMEIARQRLRAAKIGAMYAACPTCEGYGLIKTIEAAGLSILRKLQTRSARGDFGRARVALPPDVATWITNHKREDLAQLERRLHLRIEIEPRARLLRHESEMETFPREKVEAPAARIVGDRDLRLPPSEQELESARASEAPEMPALAEPAPAAAGGETPELAREPGAPRRRRRRRRRGGGAGAPAPGAAGETGVPMGPPPPPREPAMPIAAEPMASEPVAVADGNVPAGPPGMDAQDPAREGGPRRRRRRRRRRSGSAPPVAGPGANPAGGSGPSAPEAPWRNDPQPGNAPKHRDPHDETVPTSVRSDELMPAAVGGRRRRGPPRRPRRDGP